MQIKMFSQLLFVIFINNKLICELIYLLYFFIFRWITGKFATRAVKGCSSQCLTAAARSSCLCRVAARWRCTSSTRESWSRCSGVTTTMLTAASSIQTTRWDAAKGVAFVNRFYSFFFGSLLNFSFFQSSALVFTLSCLYGLMLLVICCDILNIIIMTIITRLALVSLQTCMWTKLLEDWAKQKAVSRECGTPVLSWLHGCITK